MDFESMMQAANKNAKKASREMEKVQDEVHKEKNEVKRQLEAEKRLRIEMQRRKAEQAKEIERRKEEDRRKKFTIPKRNEQESSGSGVNQDALRSFVEKQEREKKLKAKQAEIEKERLMKLRMQANGGKATKKIGKHFGLDVVDLQIRFGGNNEHIETLQKRKWKEETEAEEEADKYRTGVYKALQAKKKNEEKLRSTVSGPHRVATSKSNSLAGLCSRHDKTRDTFSPPKNGKNSNGRERREEPKRKIQHAAPVDFKSLMQAASNIAQGKSVKVDEFHKPLRPSPPSGPSSMQNSRSSQRPNGNSSSSSASSSIPKKPSSNISREQKDKVREKERERAREQERELSKVLEKERAKMKETPKPKIITSVKSVDISMDAKNNNGDKKKDDKGRFKKAVTPPPMIPAIIPGKKYLPGDVRYQQAMAMAKANAAANAKPGSSEAAYYGNQMASSSNATKDRIASVREKERLREIEREKMRNLKRARQEREYRQEGERAPKMRKVEKSDMRRYDSRREAELRAEQMRQKNGKSREDYRKKSNGSNRGTSSFCRGGDDYSDEDDDEERNDYEDDYEDDSDMDDFIDDTELDMDDMSRQEFEDTLRMVNRKYDKKKWSQREKMISERDMTSDYRRIQSEENFSKRAGIMEDLIEAKKGRSHQL